MSEFLSRSYECDVSVRNESDGRTIYGIVVPFERVARVSDGGAPYDEAFQRGAFTKHLGERQKPVMLLQQHKMNEDPLGRATLLREDAAGLYGEFKMFPTTDANNAIELAREGALSFSIGFRGVKYERRKGVVWRTEAGIREASLVTYPAYEDALVGGVRALGPDATVDDLLALIDDVPADVAIRALTRAWRGTALPEELAREVAQSFLPAVAHLIPATTPDGEPERSAEEPVEATPGDSLSEAERNKPVIQAQRSRIFTT